MFSYFIPGSTVAPTHAQLIERGLGYAFDTDNITANQIQSDTGPGQQSGVLIARDSAYAQFEKCQVWKEMPGTDGLMIGYREGHLPKPASLERKNKTCPATVPTKWNGEMWNLPQVRFYDPINKELKATPLFGFNAEFDGSQYVMGSVVSEQLDLYEAMEDALKVFLGEYEGTQGDVLMLITRVLQSAYYVSGHELALLGMIRFDKSTHVVLETLLDIAGFKQLKKKLDSVTDSAKPGSPD